MSAVAGQSMIDLLCCVSVTHATAVCHEHKSLPTCNISACVPRPAVSGCWIKYGVLDHSAECWKSIEAPLLYLIDVNATAVAFTAFPNSKV